MNILLVYPEFPDTFWGFKHVLKFTGRKAVSPPLGLLTVAAMLPTHWQKRLVDMNIRPITPDDLAWADYAFVSGMLVHRQSAREVISRCKSAGLKVVAGGPLFTSEYEQFDEVDHLVLNEAEITLAPFLADLEKGCARHIYRTSEFADIRNTPVPLWELAELKQYLYISIQYSRGCPFGCEFCDVTNLLGHVPRLKTDGQIIAELNSLYHDHGWRGGMFLADDNLIGNKKALKAELLPALIEWQKDKMNTPFATQASINLADDKQLMEMMTQAGFDIVFVGIEALDEKNLSECNKVQNKGRNLIEDIRRMQRAGLQVQGGFIIGFDGDTPSVFQRQIDFIQKSGIVTATVGLLQASPGTKLYDRLQRDGRITGPPSGDNMDGTTNIVMRMDPSTVHRGYRETLRYLYSPANYYRRVRTFMQECRAPIVKEPIQLRGLLTMIRSMYILGILGKERGHYWKLLGWTLFRRPALFPLAIAFAIQGYQYRKVFELHVIGEPCSQHAHLSAEGCR